MVRRSTGSSAADSRRSIHTDPVATWRWSLPGPHQSGKRAILVHSSQKSGEILDLGHLVCIDTYCYGGGWLTALEVRTDQVWQADREGKLRDAGASAP